jgi:methylase of polypeptide subunit release factors
MASTAEIIYRLTEAVLPSQERQRSLHDFAQEAGWYPSDELVEYPGTEHFANGHLLVEHGMANTAVISFLKPDCPFGILDKSSQLRLLELSYNNLVDWHLLPDARGLTAIYNRADPPKDFRIDDRDAWRADAFARISGRKVRPEFKALDDAFVSTVSFWKRAIGGELGSQATNERLSALFNVLIFVRAYEDHWRRIGRLSQGRLLVDLAATKPDLTIGEICREAIDSLGSQALPGFVQDLVQQLQTFRSLDSETVRELLADYYKNRFSPYSYDFSLISKHALSRIYEHYVSILRNPQNEQLQFFPGVSEELTNKTLGSYYTPQYIARFFARYLQEHTPPREFREMKIVDPACGSGIFLRTALELRCDPLDSLARVGLPGSFESILGLDVDPSACEATKLSLSLLYLVLTDSFPSSLNIQARDAIEFVQSESDAIGAFGAVMANPPYIRWESQTSAWQERASEYLGELSEGRVDAYAVLLKVGLDLLRPGGFAMYVLPHTFLYANSTRQLRKLIATKFWVRLVADLSDVKVFEDVNSYTILLIVQRRIDSSVGPLATVVKCRAEVGEALNTALRGWGTENEFFRVFETPQAIFSADTWKLLPPRQQQLLDRLERLPPLSNLAKVLQGVVTGADNVFIRKRPDVPAKERDVWRPLLIRIKLRMLIFEKVGSPSTITA